MCQLGRPYKCWFSFRKGYRASKKHSQVRPKRNRSAFFLPISGDEFLVLDRLSHWGATRSGWLLLSKGPLALVATAGVGHRALEFPRRVKRNSGQDVDRQNHHPGCGGRVMGPSTGGSLPGFRDFNYTFGRAILGVMAQGLDFIWPTVGFVCSAACRQRGLIRF